MAPASQIVLLVSTLIGIASALGIAFAVSKSATAEKRKELDRELIASQNNVINFSTQERSRLEAELTRYQDQTKQLAQRVLDLQESLTQKAAVDQLRKEINEQENTRRQEHVRQQETMQAHEMLLKDIVAQLKRQRGEIG